MQPAAPSTGQTGGAVAPQVIYRHPDRCHTRVGRWAGGGPGGGQGSSSHCSFPLLLLAGLALLAFKVAGRRRYGGGPGWYGRPWGGPGPGPGTTGATARPALRALSAIPAVSAGLRPGPALWRRLLSAGATASAAASGTTSSGQRTRPMMRTETSPAQREPSTNSPRWFRG